MVIPWGIDPTLRESHSGTEVADGVYRFTSNMTNWYLIEEDGRLSMVDSGLPDHWDLLEEGLEGLGAEIADIEAVLLTHADPDHMGLAEPLREMGVPVYVHEDDQDAALDGGADIPKRAFIHLWRPPVIRFLRAQMQAGSADVSPLAEVRTFSSDEELNVPGQPTVIHTPGHNYGQCVFWLEDRKVLFAGDALQTMDPLTGKPVEPEPERAANLDHEQAMRSAQQLTSFQEVTLLPGHGHPWTGDLEATLAGNLP